MRLLLCCVVFGFFGQGVWAEGLAKSMRPMPRPAVMVAPVVAGPVVAGPAVAKSPRPMRRPGAVPDAVAPTVFESVAAPVSPILRPKHRPEGLGIAAAKAPTAATTPKAEKQSQKGSVCGDPAIKGEVLARIRGKVKGCGLDHPVRVTAISGIRLNQPATISCDTAAALKNWIDKGLRPAMGRAEVVEIRIAASYICRPRNNKKGAKISEHGRGQAVDLAGFVFADGREWSVKQDYNKQIRKAHKAACGIFGTTLGPGSDGYHEDHLHFDIARYRSGPYCK